MNEKTEKMEIKKTLFIIIFNSGKKAIAIGKGDFLQPFRGVKLKTEIAKELLKKFNDLKEVSL